MSGKPGMQMFCEFGETGTVKQIAVKLHHPVLHIALVYFGHNVICNILTAISWIGRSTMAAFLEYMCDRGINMIGNIFVIPYIMKEFQGIIHNFCFGKADSCDTWFKERSFVFVVKSCYEKIIRNFVSGFFGCQTDTYSNIVIGAYKSIREQIFVPEFIKSMNAGFDFIILTSDTLRLKRNFITQESIPVSKKTLLILIA